MKIQLELNMPDDRIFLNYWNWYSGDDVICQLIDNKLILSGYTKKGKEINKEIILQEFCNMVKSRVDKIPKLKP